MWESLSSACDTTTNNHVFLNIDYIVKMQFGGRISWKPIDINISVVNKEVTPDTIAKRKSFCISSKYSFHAYAQKASGV